MKARCCARIDGGVSGSRIGRCISKMMVCTDHAVLHNALEAIHSEVIPIPVEVIHPHLVDGDAKNQWWPLAKVQHVFL